MIYQINPIHFFKKIINDIDFIYDIYYKLPLTIKNFAAP